jgi:hypothetical protein
MPNMPTAKIGETLQAIDEDWLSGNRGLLYRRQIRDALGGLSQAQKNEIEKAINLEEPQGTLVTIASKFRPRVQPTPDQMSKTRAIRAFLLASFTVGKIPVSRKGHLLTQVEALSTSQIAQRLVMTFPLVTSNNKRDQWGPEHFSDPAKHAGNRFRYIVHALQDPSEDVENEVQVNDLLQNPTGILQRRVAISCSVIDQDHRQTYRNYGLVLSVPKENILTTHPKDQYFSNAAGTGVYSARNSAALVEHIREKDGKYRGLSTPSEILRHTGGGYGKINEIVVTGTSPEGKKLEVIGIFVKIDRKGKALWSSQPSSSPADTEYLWMDLMVYTASKKFNLPILQILEP